MKISYALPALLLIGASVLANHGPGTSGGGSSTISGETLKAGKFDISLSENFTDFKKYTQAQAEQVAARTSDFDAIENASVTSASIAYGLSDDLQISGAIGYYSANNFIAAASDNGTTESSTADPSGLTDLNLTIKYRLLRGKPGNLSFIGGVIVPTGRDDVRTSSGERLEASSQPGSGAWAAQLGLAYSRFLTSHLTMDASGLYTFRIEHDDFRVGDRLDLGLALAYRLTESIKQFPNYSIFFETTAVWIGKDRAGEEINENSGGWTMYLSPGLRVRMSENIALTIAPAFPVLQELNSEQDKTRFKLAISLSFSN